MRTHLAALLALMVAAGCAVGSGAVVKGVGPGDLLKLREGPGLEHNIIIGLPDGTRLTRQNCVTNNARSGAESSSPTGLPSRVTFQRTTWRIADGSVSRPIAAGRPQHLLRDRAPGS